MEADKMGWVCNTKVIMGSEYNIKLEYLRGGDQLSDLAHFVNMLLTQILRK
jgi:hypothetical protein